jgi:hypothetical protein
MAYNKEDLYNEVIEAIKTNKLKHFNYIERFINATMPTLYDHFPVDSNEFKTIKRELGINRIASKLKMVNKWEDSENPTLQIAAFKLIANEDEQQALSTNWQKSEHSGEINTNKIDLSKLTEQELRAYAELQSKLERD